MGECYDASMRTHTSRIDTKLRPCPHRHPKQVVDNEDSGIYRDGRWKPEYDFTLHPSEALVLPPGYMHETFVVPAENLEDECAAWKRGEPCAEKPEDECAARRQGVCGV